MKKLIGLLLFVLTALAMPAFGQTSAPPSPTSLFSVSVQPVALRIGGQTVPGTDAVGSFNLTPRLQLQTDNTLAPANNFQQYVAGPKYYPLFLEKPFAKTSLAGIKPYIHAAIGIVRNVPPTGPSTQHYSANAGAGFDWLVNGTFSLGPLVEYMNAPGQCEPGIVHCSPHGVRVSANLNFVLAKKKP